MNNLATVQEIDANISSWQSGGTKDRALTEKDLNEIFHFFKLKTDFFNPGWLFDVVVDYVCPQVLAPVTLDFFVDVPTDLPSCSSPGTTDLLLSLVWKADTESVRELSTARIIERPSTDIYIVRQLAQNLGKNGILPPLDSLILNSVTVMRYHMPFREELWSQNVFYFPTYWEGTSLFFLQFGLPSPQQNPDRIQLCFEQTRLTEWMN